MTEWLNVAALKDTPYRRPQDFLDHIAEFEPWKETIEKATAALGVAVVDQAMAATDESQASALKAAAFATRHLGWTHQRSSHDAPRHFAFSLAMMAAVSRRCTVPCRHVERRSFRPLQAWLSLNFIACTDCMKNITRAGPPVVIDDGRCDLCDEPETIFLEAVHQVGHLTAFMNVCRPCSRFIGFKAKPPSPPRRKRRPRRRS